MGSFCLRLAGLALLAAAGADFTAEVLPSPPLALLRQPPQTLETPAQQTTEPSGPALNLSDFVPGAQSVPPLSQGAPANPERPQYYVLIAGTDDERFNGIPRTDTIIVAGVFGDGRISALHLPRDTLVQLDNQGPQKLNSAYAFGGIELLRQAVEQLLGIERIEYYVVVSLAFFTRVVDAVGGVDMCVPQRMKYDDFAGNLHIDIPQGCQRFSGELAQQFVRFRSLAGDDLARIDNLKRLAGALQERLVNPAVLFTAVPQIIRDGYTSLSSFNLPPQIVGQLLLQLPQLRLEFNTLPGVEDRISDVGSVLRPTGIREKVSEVFGAARVALEGLPRNTPITVSNNSASSGAAQEVAQRLACLGYTAVDVLDNIAGQRRAEETSVVVFRSDSTGDQELARALAELVHVPQVRGQLAIPGRGRVNLLVGNDLAQVVLELRLPACVGGR